MCGADDTPPARVTTDPHLVTCDDCASYADIEALPDDAAQGDPHVIDLIREVANGGGTLRKIDGIAVDYLTAAAIIAVYDRASPAGQATLARLRLDHMAAVAWHILGQHQK